MANKVEVFLKIKELHHRMGTAKPEILVSALQREMGMLPDEAVRHLGSLESMGLIKLKGTARGAIELTKSGITTTMKFTNPKPPEAAPEPEKV